MSEANAPAVSPIEPDLVRQARALLEFAVSQAVVPVDDALIDRAVKVISCEQPLTTETRTELWKVYNLLSAKIYPATTESIKAIRDMIADQQKRPSLFRSWRADPMVRSQIRAAILWVFLTLLLLVPAQFYSLSISSVLDTIEKSEARLENSNSELDRVELTLAAQPGDPRLKKERDSWDEKKDYDENEVSASYALLMRYAFWVKWFLPTADKEDTQLQINIRNISLSTLKGFSLYFLPLLYGLLGANVYILRQLITTLDGWSLNLLSVSKHNLRRVLGALLGATIGLLFDSNDAALATAGFGLATLAFIGGYSAELVFSLLDSFINKAKQAFAPGKEYVPSRRSEVQNTAGPAKDPASL